MITYIMLASSLKFRIMGIYLIQSRGLTKIGYTSNMKNRWAQYKLHNPTAKLIYSQEKGDRIVEQQIHSRFRQRRDHGEWFKLSPKEQKECIIYIKKLINEIGEYESFLEKWFLEREFGLHDFIGVEQPRFKLIEKENMIFCIANKDGRSYMKKGDILFKANLKGSHDIQCMFEPYDEGDFYAFYRLTEQGIRDKSFYKALDLLYKRD